MYSPFHLEIATPERLFYSGDVEMVIVSTPTGQVGILKNHMPMVLAVTSDPIRLLIDEKWKEASVASGFMEVTKDNVVLFVDSAEWPEEIDVLRAIEAKKRAEERLHFKHSQQEYVQSQAALARAISRLRVTKKD